MKNKLSLPHSLTYLNKLTKTKKSNRLKVLILADLLKISYI